MADEKKWKGGRLGPFGIGRRIEGVEADLGRLYEAHNTQTGVAAVVLVPGRGMDWEPEESWQVRVSSNEAPAYVALEVERGPASGTLPELARIFDLLTSALERVERNVQAREHLTRQPVGRVKLYVGRARRLLRSWRWRAASGLALVTLGTGLWFLFSGAGSGEHVSHGVVQEALSQADAPGLISTYNPETGVIAYPMPEKPFRNQAAVPCKPELDEVEINGGCWVTLERKPPCNKIQAEYRGKCYMPVAKDRGPREPQSIQP
ncbi:MAG TPA: hypothetical protein VE057_02815 [Archangium sp.]|nr:hypothetical protein [Archangium sp.]